VSLWGHIWLGFWAARYGGGNVSLSLIASVPAGFAISYGLGQGATMVAAFWGVFVWKEFRTAPAGTGGIVGGYVRLLF
jgi:glucose uptake protein